jgi:hypothetical protein
MGEMQENRLLSFSIKSAWRVLTIIPYFSLSYLGYAPGIVTALSMPISLCPEPGAAMMWTFWKIYLTATPAYVLFCKSSQE